MGQSDSKKEGLLGKKSKKKGGDDGCVGNKRMRSVLIGAVLIACCGLMLPYVWQNRKHWVDFKDSLAGQVACSFGGNWCSDFVNAYTMLGVGLILIIIFSIGAILSGFIGSCEGSGNKIVGIGLIIGGILYIAGETYYISKYRDSLGDACCNDTTNATLAAAFGEALLISAAAILFGLDMFMNFMEDESKRLGLNLLNCIIVSLLCFPSYADKAGNTDQGTLDTSYGLISTGYAILGTVATVYVFLWIFTFCTCDCKDSACIRMLMAVGLIIGGIMCAVGYWTMASDIDNSVFNYEGSLGNIVSYWVGYSIMVGGYSVIWALDIAFDDVKNSTR